MLAPSTEDQPNPPNNYSWFHSIHLDSIRETRNEFPKPIRGTLVPFFRGYNEIIRLQDQLIVIVYEICLLGG
jgi:hypothetical protein